MKCPNCVLGDLQFIIRGELRFQTDDKGRPCGTADVRTDPDHLYVVCDTCRVNYGVQGWRGDGSGEVILAENEASIEDA